MEELSDYVLGKTREASELFKNLDQNEYLQDIALSVKVERAGDYLYSLGNFYKSLDKGELDTSQEAGFMKDFKNYFHDTEKTINGRDINFEEGSLRNMKGGRVFLGLLTLLAGSGIYLEPLFIIPTAFCGYKAIKMHFTLKKRERKLNIQKELCGQIENIDENELKMVLLEKRGDIMPMLPV